MLYWMRGRRLPFRSVTSEGLCLVCAEGQGSRCGTSAAPVGGEKKGGSACSALLCSWRVYEIMVVLFAVSRVSKVKAKIDLPLARGVPGILASTLGIGLSLDLIDSADGAREAVSVSSIAWDSCSHPNPTSSTPKPLHGHSPCDRMSTGPRGRACNIGRPYFTHLSLYVLEVPFV